MKLKTAFLGIISFFPGGQSCLNCPESPEKEVASILEVNGFIKVRQRGSHMVLQKRLKTTTITVPVPDHLERGQRRDLVAYLMHPVQVK